MRKLITLLFGLILLSQVKAQSQPPGPGTIKPLRIGIGLLGAAYSGDINYEGQQYYRFYPGFDLSFEFAGDGFLKPQLRAGFGKFVTQNRDLEDVPGYNIARYVETGFFFFDFRLKARFLRRKKVSPYLAAGIGLLNYTPRDAEGNALADNFESRLETEEYGSMTAGFPLSIGVDIRFSPIISLGLDYTHKPTGTDYLDNLGELGNKEGNDRMNTFTLSIFITFDPENPILKENLRTRERRRL